MVLVEFLIFNDISLKLGLRNLKLSFTNDRALFLSFAAYSPESDNLVR